ncbi:L,D-transpeptidase family protein [Hyphomicrobium sp. B1]|uniref:L,D-transpeptidase family protein n=1 Tax=Hyphomicrobium sp. B1 TaxID=3075651 RepID=UPI003C2BCFAF
MNLPRRLSGLALAALIMAGGLVSASSAKAEDLVDFLWGGSPEYGGGRSIVSFDPQYKPGQIIVSFSDRRLYWIMKPGVALTYPVAIPTGEARWQGVTKVSAKRVNPPWTPTPEMVRNNPRLPRWVPGGHPMNPLGIRAMYLGSSAYRIHGTDAPWTIGQAVSHGCIRMTNQDVLDLYPRVPVGTRVTVTWQQFKTQTISDGSNLPRYTDKDSNPRAAAAVPAQSQQPEQTAAKQSTGGGIESLFFWDEPKKAVATASASEPEPQNDQQNARDATKDDDDFVPEKKAEAEKPAKKVHEARAVIEEQAPTDAPKKKATNASAAKKKPAAAAVAKVPSASDPSTDPTVAVPDPVKPTAATRASDATPRATKASVSSSEIAHVQQASVRVQ